jgi:hypothetical protein
MTKLTVTTLKQSLSTKSNKELVQEIADLYKKFSIVKEYYQAREGSPEDIVEKYKDIIKKEFTYGHTRGMPKARLSVARKAVQDFKKLSEKPDVLIDLMLTFVEEVSDFNTEFGPDSEPYYTSPEGMYDDVLSLMDKSDLLATFQVRAKLIAQHATDAWGHSDSLSASYQDYYNND